MKYTNADTLELFLPEGTLEWFDVVSSKRNGKEIRIVLEEKNIPPVSPDHEGLTITSKGLKPITVEDFPARGRRVTLVYRRRYWQVEGKKEYLKRDMNICAPGTKLEKEFAAFLKETSPDRNY